MDLHIGDSLLTGCLTCGCLIGNIPSSIGILLANMGDGPL
jgi:hypothetical protein